MEKRKRRRFTPEFKAKGVALVRTSGKSVAEVARDLDLTPSALGGWVKRAEIDAGRGPAGALMTEERKELARLRKENKVLREEREIPKGGGLLRQREAMKFAFIEAEKAHHNVSALCRVMRVSRSGFYAWRNREPSAHALVDARLGTLIVLAYRAGRGAYGSPRVLRELRERGERTSRKRVARLMRERGLVGLMKKRWRHPAAAATNDACPANVLDRDFVVDAPNKVWVTDITYVRTWEGWLYVAVVLDLYARRVVGWSMQSHIRADLVLDALTMAVGQRLPAPGLLAHSDRGSQYTSEDYQRALRAHGIVCSMSGRGNCWDNAVVESFFGTLKRELVNRRSWPTRREAAAAIHEYIEVFYNRRRRHSTLDYRTPTEYEALYTEPVTLAA